MVEGAGDLMSIEGVDADLVGKLAAAEISDREGLAELAVDELVEIAGIEEDRARDIIMKARAHWFE
jgi:transcription termination/antitermination protein NusA